MDNIVFAQQFLKPKTYGNFVRDLNPLSKLNMFLVMGLSVFFVGNYWYGFALVGILFLVALAAGKLKSYLSVLLESPFIIWRFLICGKSCFFSGRAYHLADVGNPCFNREYSGSITVDFKCISLQWCSNHVCTND